MTEMVNKIKINWENITKVLLYVFLIGIVIGLFYYLVAIPTIDVLSKPFPGGFSFGVVGFFNMVVWTMVNLKYRIKFDWDNLTESLIYIFLIGIILVLFYFVVQLMIKGLSQSPPGIYPIAVGGFIQYRGI